MNAPSAWLLNTGGKCESTQPAPSACGGECESTQPLLPPVTVAVNANQAGAVSEGQASSTINKDSLRLGYGIGADTMSAKPEPSSYDNPALKAKRSPNTPPPLASPGPSAPATFFLKSEREMEFGRQPQRGRRISRGSAGDSSVQMTPQASSLRDSSFAVQSLENTIGSLRPARSLSSTHSNPSQPLTPLRLSPQPESAMPSTPRSASIKSFRWSDEEGSVADGVADETRSQAIHSSSGEEEDEGSSSLEPRLVMPSIAMPARRPFTQRGRHIGRLKVMLVGPSGVGKTSLIRSIFRTCEHIVHLDPLSTTPGPSSTINTGIITEPTSRITDYHASTTSYPAWWSDMESTSVWRRKSFAEPVLERNICFIDTPGIDRPGAAQLILEDWEVIMQQNARMESWGDGPLLSLLSGEGGLQVHAVLYVFAPEHTALAEGEQEVLSKLCRWTNVIPLIGRADTCSAEELETRRRQLLHSLASLPCDWYHLLEPILDLPRSDSSRLEPLTISSALSDDAETMDASLLMSSDYLPPLLHSDLPYFVDRFLSPGNIARLRHTSAKKFLLWRRETLGLSIDLHKQRLLHSPRLDLPSSSVITSPAMTGHMSPVDEPSKVLVPHSTSSFYRSSSPSAASLDLAGKESGTYSLALAHQHQHEHQPTEPYRQFRMAKWAQDLQRSLENERRRYTRLYGQRAPESPAHEKARNASDQERQVALLPPRADALPQPAKPAKGRLGGALAIIDPRDPLGVLAFSQACRHPRCFALQVAGGCGLLAAAAFWLLRNWVEVQDFFAFAAQARYAVHVRVVAPPQGEGLGLGLRTGLAEWVQQAAEAARALAGFR